MSAVCVCVRVGVCLLRYGLQVDCHDDGRSAHLGFMNEAAELNNFSAALATEDQIDQRIRKQRAAAAVMADPDPAESESLPDSSVDDSDMDMSFSSLVSAASSKDPPKPKRPRRTAITGNETNQQPLQHKPMEPLNANPALQAGVVQAAGKAPCRTPAEQKSKALLKAEKIMEVKGKLLSDASLWDSKPRLKSVEAAAKAMEATASELLGDDAAENLMATMLQLAEWSPKKLELFGRIRKDYRAMIASISPADVDVLSWVSGDVLENIYTAVAMMLLKDLEQDCRGFVFILNFTQGSNWRIYHMPLN